MRLGRRRAGLVPALLREVVDLPALLLRRDVAHRGKTVDLVREGGLSQAEEVGEFLLGDPGHLLNRLQDTELGLRRAVLEDRRGRRVRRGETAGTSPAPGTEGSPRGG